MSKRVCAISILAAILAATFGRAADAGQHLVAPGNGWEQLAAQLHPGDEIILMPGRHRPAWLRDCAGTAKRPIVIRSLTTDQPATIAAEKEGIRLTGCRHVIIRDLTISGATLNGIEAEPPGGTEERFAASLRIENVRIERTGPEGRRHAIKIRRLEGVDIVGCTLSGWGGSGIDMTGSSRIKIADCRLEGVKGFSHRAAITVRGESERVQISDCTMIDAGVFGLEIGGEGDPGKPVHRPGRTNEPETTLTRAHTATRVRVARCVIEGGQCPVQFFSAADCSVRNVTFVRPRQIVLSVDLAEPELVFLPSQKLTFGTNLIVWEAGDLRALARTGPRLAERALQIEENLWWSPEDAERRAALGPLPVQPVFPQVTTIDPRLDADRRPQEAAAELFGAHAP